MWGDSNSDIDSSPLDGAADFGDYGQNNLGSNSADDDSYNDGGSPLDGAANFGDYGQNNLGAGHDFGSNDLSSDLTSQVNASWNAATTTDLNLFGGSSSNQGGASSFGNINFTTANLGESFNWGDYLGSGYNFDIDNPIPELNNSLSYNIASALISTVFSFFALPAAGLAFGMAVTLGLNYTAAQAISMGVAGAMSYASFAVEVNPSGVMLSDDPDTGAGETNASVPDVLLELNDYKESSLDTSFVLFDDTQSKWLAGGRFYNSCMAGGEMFNPTGLMEKEQRLVGNIDNSDRSFFVAFNSPYEDLAGGVMTDKYAGSKNWKGDSIGV